MVAYCSRKRSVPMDEEEARTIAKKTTLFGYEPMIFGPYRGRFHLIVRGDGADDAAISLQLAQMRAHITHPQSTTNRRI